LQQLPAIQKIYTPIKKTKPASRINEAATIYSSARESNWQRKIPVRQITSKADNLLIAGFKIKQLGLTKTRLRIRFSSTFYTKNPLFFKQKKSGF